MKYDTIIKCDLIDNVYGGKYENCYLLTYSGCSKELEIDLTGDLCFNELEKNNVKEIAKVNNLNDLIMFAKENNFNNTIYRLEKNTLDNGRLVVGGWCDYILDNNLSVLGWEEEF